MNPPSRLLSEDFVAEHRSLHKQPHSRTHRKERVSICATGVALKSLRERLVFVWVTIVWLARWTWLLAIGIAWLATLGFAIYEFRFYRGRSLIGFLASCALVLFLLGVWFVSTVNKFYDWWQRQALKTIKAKTPEQHLDNLLKEYESRVALNFSESMKSQFASSPTFQATVTEATKLVLEAVCLSK